MTHITKTMNLTKSKINIQLEKFDTEGIQQLRQIIENHKQQGKDVDALEYRLGVYEELYAQVQRLLYSHAMFVYAINKFHKRNIATGFIDGDGNVDLDCLEDDIQNNYKIILSLINYYTEYEKEFSENDDVILFIKSLQEECDGIRFV